MVDLLVVVVVVSVVVLVVIVLLVLLVVGRVLVGVTEGLVSLFLDDFLVVIVFGVFVVVTVMVLGLGFVGLILVAFFGLGGGSVVILLDVFLVVARDSTKGNRPRVRS